MKKNYWHKGFSLVQVILAGAMLSGLALVSMRMMKNVGDAQGRMGNKTDELQLRNEIHLILSDPTACRISLAGNGILGVPTTPELFFKSAIDEDDEGKNIELHYADQNGNARTIKKFNGSDNIVAPDRSKYGRIEITSMKLIMDNPDSSGNLNWDYSVSSFHRDFGRIKVEILKKVSETQDITLIQNYPVSLGMRTDAAGETTILSCSENLSSGEIIPYALLEVSSGGVIINSSSEIIGVSKVGDVYTVTMNAHPNGANYRVMAVPNNNTPTTVLVDNKVATSFRLRPYRKTGGGSDTSTSVAMTIIVY